MEYKFKEKWDENTDINWWKESRIELNKIIEIYNNWQIEGCGSIRAKFLLTKIEYGKQTIGARDGGSGYFDELDEMETFVKENINESTVEEPIIEPEYSNKIEEKLMFKYQQLNGYVNDPQYDGYSDFYRSCREDIPKELDSLIWTVNELLGDVLTPDFTEKYINLLSNIKY